MSLRTPTDASGVGEQQRLAIEDRRGVLHRAGGEVGDGDDVELLERVFDRVVAVVVLDDLLRSTRGRSRSAPSCRASSRCGSGSRRRCRELHSKSPTASATRYVDIFGVVSNLTVCLPAAGPGVSETTAPFEMAWSLFVDDRREREGRLERRLVERREHAPRVGGFELRDRVAAIVGLAQIEAAQVVVEDARHRRWSARRRRPARGGNRKVACSFVASSVTSAVCVRPPALIDALAELDLGGVQHDRGRWAREA